MEFCQELAKLALGWLGWSEYQTLYSDVNAIKLAWAGFVEKTNHMHGKKPDGQNMQNVPPSQRQALMKSGAKVYYGGGGKPLVLTPQAFDAAFGSNAGRRRFIKPKR